ncbi:hypothetical protein F4824DRAFT_497477 [Ustulina deusta]|nr:hypothetical protein F4824DRAFT_497477 [Ustulina deusta]
MPEYDYVKITSPPRFQRSQSFSHHHHHHHRPRHARARCPENCACVSVDHWNDAVERERSLKDELRIVCQENQRLQSSKRGLQAEVDQLRGHLSHDGDAAAKLRRRVAALKAEVEAKDAALRELQKEKEVADIRVRELSVTVSNQGAELTQLEDDAVRMRRAHQKDQYDLGVRIDEARRAWGMVSDLQRRLRDCRLFPWRPGYGFA